MGIVGLGAAFPVYPFGGWSMNQIVKYLGIALLVLPALYLLVWGPSSDAPTPPGYVVVDYWEKWTANEEAAMKIIVDDFNRTVGNDKHIFVRYVSTSNVNQKTLVSTAAGVPPDIAGLWDNNMAQFASLDALMPLDDLAKEYGINESTYLPVYWNACHFDGHLYALVSTPAAVALHYNTDEFREAGLDPDHPPQTLQELDHDAELLEKRGPNGRIIRSGYLPTEPGWFVNQTYMWFGGSIWDDVHHKFTLTDPAVVKAFAWVQSYSKRLGKDAINEFHGAAGSFDTPQNPFLAGTMSMTQQGPWMAFYILTRKPSLDGLPEDGKDDIKAPLAERRKRMHWAAAPFPSAVPGLTNVTYCGFDTFVIPRGAKHPREAFEFMAYVNSQAVMEKLCNMHSKNSPLTKVSQNFLEHHKNPYIDVFENLSRSPNAHMLPQIPIYPEVDAELTILVQQLALLDAEPGPALQELQDRLQKSYDKFVEIQNARKAAGLR
jgi:multiple sugar transport system substrate-binding protein